MPNNILCRASALIIRENKLLFAKNVNHPCYYLVGGGIEENETSEEAVIREIFEETGLKLKVDKLVMIQERFCKVENRKHHEIAFFYLIKDTDRINIPDNVLLTREQKKPYIGFP